MLRFKNELVKDMDEDVYQSNRKKRLAPFSNNEYNSSLMLLDFHSRNSPDSSFIE